MAASDPNNNKKNEGTTKKHRYNVSTSRRKRRTAQRRDENDIDPMSYVPPYLQPYIMHYHDDFYLSPSFDPNLIMALMYEGFLSIATQNSTGDYYLLPKLHAKRCVIRFDEVHVSRSPRRKSRDYVLKVNTDFDGVVKGCHDQHGVAWLYPPMVAALKYIYENGAEMNSRVRVYSIELYRKPSEEEDGETSQDEMTLVAGELGYSVHAVYTSLTGFFTADSTGTIQLLSLAGLLKTQGFQLWDLGMEMEYKMQLGAVNLDRGAFLTEMHRLRRREDDVAGCVSLDGAVRSEGGREAKALIDSLK